MATGTVAGAKIFRVGIHLTVLQQRIQTGFYLRDVGIENQSAMDAVDATKEWVDTKFRTLIPSSVAFDRIEATETQTKEFAQQELISYNGTAGATVSTTMFAGLVSLKTDSRQRHKTGRMYWPLLMAGSVEQGVIVGGLQSVWLDVIADFADRFTGSSLTHDFRCCVVSAARPASPTRPAIEHSWTDVEVIKLDPIARIQQRRRIGRGS